MCDLIDNYQYDKNSVFVADRGISSYNVYAHATKNNVKFAIRTKDKNISRMLKIDTLSDNIDSTINITLTRTVSKKKWKKQENIDSYRYICKATSLNILMIKT